MATVLTAGVTFSVLVVMMVAFCVRVIIKLSAYIGNYCLVGTALYTAVKLDSCLSKSILCTAADAAADEHINILC